MIRDMTDIQLEELKKQYPPFSGKAATNAIDLTNQQFGNLKVLYRTENLKKNKASWVCECQCDKHTIVVKQASELRQGKVTGCGCTKGNRTTEVEPGTMFGYWKVLERVPNHQGDMVYYSCLCTKCNKTIKEVGYKHLKSGASTKCQICNGKQMSEKNVKDESGKIYGHLKVTKSVPDNLRPRQDRTGIYWYCDCLNCGKKDIIIFGDYLRNGDTTSCGCRNISKNEKKIIQLMQNNHFLYQPQYYFIDLIDPTSGYNLRFDFGIVDKSNQLLYLIEYDGEQHFKKAGWDNYSIENLENRHKKDLIKNQYCFKNNIPLIRIPYDKDYTIEDLKLATTRFLLTPENENSYYKPRLNQ